MSTNLLEINNSNNLEVNTGADTYLSEKQKSFLETNLGKTINLGLDIGLKAILPGIIEDQAIEVKDALLTEGVSVAVNTAINSAVDLGKSVIGIFTGNFESISQVNDALKKGGLLDTVSDILDTAIDVAKSSDIINSKTAKLIKSGKNTILDTVSDNIDDNLSSQIESAEKINTYIEKWKGYYEEKDFTNMSKQYTKIEKELTNIMPLEDIITKARQLENIHNLIKNNGRNFELSADELSLANKLI